MTNPLASQKIPIYGPGTPLVRQFLVQLAGLGATARDDVVQRHVAVVNTRAHVIAETLVGDTIERAGRTDARDALAGPLLQLVRNTKPVQDDEDVLASLAPIAEPALAALLALLAADLLPPETVTALYAPFAEVIPFGSLGAVMRAP